jgi:hypothetical protein
MVLLSHTRSDGVHSPCADFQGFPSAIRHGGLAEQRKVNQIQVNPTYRFHFLHGWARINKGESAARSRRRQGLTRKTAQKNQRHN